MALFRPLVRNGVQYRKSGSLIVLRIKFFIFMPILLKRADGRTHGLFFQALAQLEVENRRKCVKTTSNVKARNTSQVR